MPSTASTAPGSSPIGGLGGHAGLLHSLEHLLELGTTGLFVRPVVQGDIVPRDEVSN